MHQELPEKGHWDSQFGKQGCKGGFMVLSLNSHRIELYKSHPIKVISIRECLRISSASSDHHHIALSKMGHKGSSIGCGSFVIPRHFETDGPLMRRCIKSFIHLISRLRSFYIKKTYLMNN